MIFAAISLYAIRTFSQMVVKNKLLQAENRLRLQINRFQNEYKGVAENPGDFIGSALGEMGLDKVIEQLGIDPSILKNPLVRGLIDKYAPKLLEQLQNKGGGNDRGGGL